MKIVQNYSDRYKTILGLPQEVFGTKFRNGARVFETKSMVAKEVFEIQNRLWNCCKIIRLLQH
jgi:hypothetical protein